MGAKPARPKKNEIAVNRAINLKLKEDSVWGHHGAEIDNIIVEKKQLPISKMLSIPLNWNTLFPSLKK